MATKKRYQTVLFLLLLLFSFGCAEKTTHKIDLSVELSNPFLEAGKKQVTTLKVGLTGFDLPTQDRAPVNVALVLDRSGSMSGDKIVKAKEAALLVVDMLGKDDIFSLITYDTEVRTLVPATKLTDKSSVKSKIRRITDGGSTALFGGVSKGISEVDKFLDVNRVNRVILLSDGIANVGPSSPYELGRLGISAAKKGISVTTIGLGLGYNEDLMTQLALKSDGNHAFVENSRDLVTIFNKELGDVLSVVAQDVNIKIICDDNIRPVRVLDREATIRGSEITLNLNQLYSNQEKYILLEVEVPAGSVNKKQQIAMVDIDYNNLKTGRRDKMKGRTSVNFTKSKEVVKKSVNKDVAVKAVKATANMRSKAAVKLRDKGDILGAEKLMMQNTADFKGFGAMYQDDELMMEAEESEKMEKLLKEEKNWNRTRKTLKKKQQETTSQQKKYKK